MRLPPFLLLPLLGLSAIATIGAGAARFEPDREARAPTLDGFGSAAMAITTPAAEAQRWFTRGLLQAYAFNHLEAARDFKAALAQDPRCAMCAWGVAWVLGPNINAVERRDLGEARRYVALARDNSDGVSERERALIEALATRYGDADDPPSPGARPASNPVAASDPVAASGAAPASAALAALPAAAICSSGSSTAAHPLDIAYAARMHALVEAYPGDPDIVALDAEATMIATRVDWWARTTGAPAPGIAEMSARLERALAQSPEHPGLNHYLIHAVDQSPAPQRARVAADRLGSIAPESPHLLHMPAHIYVRIGRYGDAVRVNQEALAAEVRQTKKLEAQGFGPSVNWDGHNLHFLWFAALMDGRGDSALAQARRLAERAAAGKSATAEFMRSLPLLTLARFERWTEVLAAPVPEGDAGIAAALGHYARGVALARRGDNADAAAEAAALRAARDAPALAGKTVLGDDPAKKVLDVLAARLDAEVAAANGAADAARTSLERGIKVESALEANEPPLLGAGSRIALGELMLRSRNWRDAESAFRADLADQPGNGWALRGLERALAGQGRTEAARRVRTELDQAWAAADPGLRVGSQ